MADSPKLPDQFHRSRVTSLTASFLMLGLSIEASNTYAEIPLFGFKLHHINKETLLFSVFVVAAISLASLWFIYLDEVSAFIRVKQPELRLADIETVIHSSREAVSGVDKLAADVRETFAKVDLSALFTHAPSCARPTEAFRIIVSDALSTKLTSELYGHITRTRKILEERGLYEDDVKHTFEWIEHTSTEIDRWRHSLEDHLLHPPGFSSWKIKDINDLQSHLVDRMDATSAGLIYLSGELRKYVRAAKRGSRIRSAEYQAVGVWAPSALFGIATAHAIGVLFGGFIPNFPTIVSWCVGKLT